MKTFVVDTYGINNLKTTFGYLGSYLNINSISGEVLDRLVTQKEVSSGDKFIQKDLLLEWDDQNKLWSHINSFGIRITDINIDIIHLREFVISDISSGLVYTATKYKDFKPLYTLSKLQKIEIRQKEFYGEEFWNVKKRELDLLLAFKKTLKGKPTDEQRETLNHNNFMIDQLKKTLYGNDYNKS